MNSNTEFLRIGPCNIGYKGERIGVTLDSPLMNIEPGFYESICDKAEDQTVCKIITNMKIIISAEVNKINIAFANFYDANGEITGITFGKDVLTTGGELCLSPVFGDDSICYCFPRAVLVPEIVYACKRAKDYYLKIYFEVYEDSEGVLIQKYSR